MAKRFVIATQHGYTGDDYATKAAARKALSSIVRDEAAKCRRSHKTCSVVGSSAKGSVQIKVGGRQGYHLWQRFIINQKNHLDY